MVLLRLLVISSLELQRQVFVLLFLLLLKLSLFQRFLVTSSQQAPPLSEMLVNFML